jgi:hypothetical protein
MVSVWSKNQHLIGIDTTGDSLAVHFPHKMPGGVHLVVKESNEELGKNSRFRMGTGLD